MRKFTENLNIDDEKLVSQNIEVFNWLDIQREICKDMGIDEKYFRDYHKIIGGDYKDLWHEWMEYFDEVYNDTIRHNDLSDSMESKLEWVKDDGKDWLEPFITSIYKIWDKYGIEYVKYSW
jgi:hypothetical protein